MNKTTSTQKKTVELSQLFELGSKQHVTADILRAVFTDPADLFLWLKHQHIPSLSQDLRFSAFRYLAHTINEDAQERGLIRRRRIETKHAYYNIPAMDEAPYEQDTNVLSQLIYDANYSTAIQKELSTLTQSVAERLCAIPEARRDVYLWSSSTLDSRRTLAYAILYTHSEAIREHFQIPFDDVPFYYIDDDDCPDFFHAAPPIIDDSDEEIFIASSLRSIQSDDVAGYASLLYHEKIHNFFYQLAKLYKTGKIEPDHALYNDAKLSYARKSHGIALAPGHIRSLYFADSEELCCYENQFAFERQIARLTPSRQIAKMRPQPI